MSQFHIKLAAMVAAGVLLVGCETTPTEEETEATVIDQSTSGDGSDVTTTGVTDPSVWTGHPLDDPASLLSAKVVYFDFDRSDVRLEDRSTIEAHALYLQNHPNAQISLEGHADERGTREYNNALGEARGKAVRSLMTLIGGSGQQLRVVSYGEERPVNRSHDESAWAENRRVEIVYLSRD